MPKDYTDYAKKTLKKLVDRLSEKRDGTYSELSITYKELAESIGFEGLSSGPGFPKKIAEMLGRLGDMLKAVGTKIDQKVPQIQVLVVRQDTGIPGEGIDAYIPGYQAADETGRRALAENEFSAIINFGKNWDMVIAEIEKIF